MKNILKIIFFQLLLFFIINTNTFSQIKFKSINAGLTIGSISSSSPSFTTLGGKLSTDFNLWFSNDVSFRFGFEHSRMLEYFFPEDRINKTYPFVNILSLTSFINQNIYKKIFLEESVGLILLRDKTFSDRSYWEYGTTFSLASGLDFRDSENYGAKLSLGINYGLTFNKTSVNYNLIAIQINYYFRL
ncbi:hypothetical protein [Stygiobacter electus]|uniref:Outer membrane protein beta-barrel domain-containing protein n=1 Tax=Stygiobacter electus TaxID=3032292 RepID=A0AAE3NVP3_9BACT|nr:hypothetical protein [Stygiobacter electus]MDF1611711.1 hypothetical protein [Stygiobacter electus]